MPRRKPYTKVQKQGQNRPDHVAGMGDVVFRGFQCLRDTCQQFITVEEEELTADFEVVCPKCGFKHEAGGESRFFGYQLVHTGENKVIEEGDFVVLHDDYIEEAQQYKYCLNCYALKPVDLFSNHGSRKSGRQGECRLCKTLYNGIKNQSRITDQHREAAQRRRLYRRLTGEAGKIDSKAIFDKFKGRCFKCDREVTFTDKGSRDFNLDHTLPVSLLWPLLTENGTLLCTTCNGEKGNKWPSEVYGVPKLKSLAHLTGYPYELLAGPAVVNEDALGEILADPDAFIEEWIHYPDDIKKVRRMVQQHAGVDIFADANHVPGHLRDDDEDED